MSLTVRLPRRRIQILISTNGRNEGLLGVARRRRQEGLKRARFRGTPSETPRHAEESLVVCPLALFVASLEIVDHKSTGVDDRRNRASFDEIFYFRLIFKIVSTF